MKEIFRFLLSFLLILMLLSTLAYADNSINICVNGVTLNFDKSTGIPFIDSNHRTQVPLRIALEKYGAKVDWNNQTKTAIILYDDIVVEVPISENFIFKNHEKITTDSCAIIKDGKTYLPIRPVMEALCAEVKWNGTTKTIDICKDSTYNDEKYNYDMAEQYGNKINFGNFVYDKNYQYFIVSGNNESNKIMRKNLVTKEVENIYYTIFDLDKISICKNQLYFIESFFETASMVKKIDLTTLDVTECYKCVSDAEEACNIDDYVIYGNELYLNLYFRKAELDGNKINYSYRFVIGKVNCYVDIDVLYTNNGYSDNLYCYNSKLYFEDKSNIVEYNMETKETNKLFENIYDYTFNKNKLYINDDDEIYEINLDTKEKKLLYALDTKVFTNMCSSIHCLNYHNGKMYFVVSPDWVLYTLGNDGKPKRVLYMNDWPENCAVYGNNCFYINQDSDEKLVGGTNIKVDDIQVLGKWLNTDIQKNEKTDVPKYYYNITKIDKDRALKIAQNGTTSIAGYLLDNSYFPNPLQPSIYNKYVKYILVFTPIVDIMGNIDNIKYINNYDKTYESMFVQNKYMQFNVYYFCDSKSKPKDMRAYIEQDGKKCELMIYSQTAAPSETNFYPNTPKYIIDICFTYFNTQNEINLNKEAELIIDHNGDGKCLSTFFIDFSSIK